MSTSPKPLERQVSHRHAAAAFWKLMYQVAVVAGATHVMFMGLFYGLGAIMLTWVNLGSVLLFAASYVCLKKRFNLLAVSLIVLEILSHATMAVRAIGWDSGFHYYLLVMAPIVVISQMKIRVFKPMLLASLLALYMTLDYTMRDLAPYDTISTQTLSALRYFNIAVTFLLLTYLSSVYLKMVTQAEAKLRALATTDPLTHLLNRRSLLDLAANELAHREQDHSPLAFVLADIDHFKSINDQHGHAAGDAVLTKVSAVLQQALRGQDSVARWGGEEFLILMPNATLEVASAVAERLRKQIADIDVSYGDAHIKVSMTFGVSSHLDGEDLDASVSRADSALYRGKVAGRNQVVAAVS